MMNDQEFWNQLRMVIREELNILRNTSPEANVPVYTIKGFCERFHISKPTLFEWIKMGKITPVKIGRRVYFRATDVEGLVG